jgi:hypothetical protein
MSDNILSDFVSFTKTSEVSLAPAPAPQTNAAMSGIDTPRANVHNALADTAPESVPQAKPLPNKTSNAPLKPINFKPIK